MILALKRPWSDGTTALRFKQVDFVERIMALVPPRGLTSDATKESSLQGMHGGPQVKRPPRAPNDPPPPDHPSACRAVAERYIPWAELLRRTYGIDAEICTCGARMRIEDVVTDGDTITEVLVAMGLAALK